MDKTEKYLWLFHQANNAFRSGKYDEALSLYHKVLNSTCSPVLRVQIEFNTMLANRKAYSTNISSPQDKETGETVSSAFVSTPKNIVHQREVEEPKAGVQDGCRMSALWDNADNQEQPKGQCGKQSLYLDWLERAYAQRLKVEQAAVALKKNLISRSAEVRALKQRLRETTVQRNAANESNKGKDSEDGVCINKEGGLRENYTSFIVPTAAPYGAREFVPMGEWKIYRTFEPANRYQGLILLCHLNFRPQNHPIASVLSYRSMSRLRCLCRASSC